MTSIHTFHPLRIKYPYTRPNQKKCATQPRVAHLSRLVCKANLALEKYYCICNANLLKKDGKLKKEAINPVFAFLGIIITFLNKSVSLSRFNPRIQST